MKRSRRRSAPGKSGDKSAKTILAIGALTLLAVFFGYSAMFLVAQDSSLWTFDRRTVQHFICFVGIGLLAPGVASGMGDRLVRRFFTTLGGMAVVFVWLWFTGRPNDLNTEADVILEIICTFGTVLVPIYALFAWCAKGLSWTRMRWSWIGAAITLGLSLWWELIQQPLIGSYGHPARDTIQVGQLVADSIGLALGFATYLLVIGRMTSGHADSDSQAFVST